MNILGVIAVKISAATFQKKEKISAAVAWYGALDEEDKSHKTVVQTVRRI